MPASTPDVAIIGGGIVGLATAYALMRQQPKLRLSVLEKEDRLAHHQTGHNSGVLHSGIYYKPGSLKARNCRAGKAAMERFCQEHGIPFRLCGKVIVATDDRELPKLRDLFARGQANGVDCALISAERCRELEPHVRVAAAIHVPEAGIVDYRKICDALGEQIRAAGHEILTGARVIALKRDGPRQRVITPNENVSARLVINCAGLQSDRVTRMAGIKPAARIIPFRGEYFELKPQAHHLCQGLVYPVPDPAFPFLGVHFTRMIQGGVECGPNAVLAWGRECYGKFQIHPGDLAGSLTYPGFLKMAARHWRMGLGEMWRSYSKTAFVKALQRLMPEIREEDLAPCPSGIRAQAVTSDGGLVDDFLIDQGPGVINVNNAPSPAATASLAIGESIAARAREQLD
ncbi:MAG: L-2-hydroxyglutarate oxidase [Planctomycetota bacterium]